MRGTLDNIASAGLPDALTGPIRRGDVDTVARHLDALAGAAPEVIETYRVLGALTLALTRRGGEVDGGRLDEIAELLGGGSPGSTAQAG
jgi:predicted short-subunit dehydrogenase-like oxidoreductase (DUF2520 family)